MAGEGNSDRKRERERDLDEAGQHRRGTQQQNECFLDCHAPPLPPTELLPHHRVKTQAGVRERESSHALLLSPAWEEETRDSSTLSSARGEETDRGGGEASEE